MVQAWGEQEAAWRDSSQGTGPRRPQPLMLLHLHHGTGMALHELPSADRHRVEGRHHDGSLRPECSAQHLHGPGEVLCLCSYTHVPVPMRVRGCLVLPQAWT